jgi:hypothetical protein
MSRAQDFKAKAEQFAARAAHAKLRTERNTFLSLEQSCRQLAADEEAPDGPAPAAPDREFR